MCQKCLHCIWCNYIHSSCPPGCSCRWMFLKTVLRDGAQTIWTHHAQPNPQFTQRDDKGLRQYRSCLNIYTPCWVLEFTELPASWHMGIPDSHYSLGTPETSRRGRSTRKARRALTSNPPGLPPCPCSDGWLLSPSPSPFSSLVKNSKTTLKSLSENKKRSIF